MRVLGWLCLVSAGSVLTFLAVRHIIAHEIIPWSVADAHGHGPDYGGAEWRGALTGQARLYGCLAAAAFAVWTLALGVSLKLRSWLPISLSGFVLGFGYIVHAAWDHGLLRW